MRSNLICLLCVIVVAFIFCGCVSAATVNTNQITSIKKDVVGSNYIFDTEPAVYGKYIVWSQRTLNSASINRRNIATGKTSKVIINPNLRNPVISGSRIAWVKYKWELNHYYTSIYLKNMSNGYFAKIFPSTYNQTNPSISDTRMVWQQDLSNGKSAIYYKNLLLGSTKKLQVSTHNQYNPVISGTRIAWTQYDSPGHSVIYAKNLATGYSGKVFATKQNQDNACISGTNIVWQQLDPTGKWTVYYKNMLTGSIRKIQTSTNDQTVPKISGSRIVWLENNEFFYSDSTKDCRYSAIKYKNIKTGTTSTLASKTFSYLSLDGKDLFNPNISNSRVVWQETTTLNEIPSMSRIYYKNLETGKTISFL